MARPTESLKNIGQLIDQIERIREELLTIQRTLEEMESKKDTPDARKAK